MAEKQPEAPSLPSEESLKRLAISESGFVFDPVSGHHFTANETGLVILRQLQKDQDFNHLLLWLQNEYDASPRELERDTIEFIGILRDFVGE